MSGRAFYSLVLSFFTGVFIVSLWRESFILVCLVLVITCALWFARVKMPSLVIGCVVLCVLGAGRTELSYSGVHPLDTLPGVIEGVVCDEPQRKDLVQKFCFAPDKSPDRILVTRAKYPTFSYGDRLRLEGKLEFPENFETDGGIEFDYISYLAKDDIRYIMYRPKAELVSHDNGNVLVSVLYSIRSAFIRKMQDLFPEPESSLLGGVLLGDRSSLPQDISDEFRNAGLVHILVLSGSNVTVVAESLMKAFAFLPRMIGQLFGAVSIVLFALMTGASATTVRASIMALVVIVARSSARRYDVTRALCVAAFCMILHNPRILVFDASFQLSLLSTLALIYVAPVLEKKLSFITERFGLREMIATTLGTQLFTAPLILHMMGQMSVVALVPNLLVLPTVPWSMLGGFIAVTIGFISHMLALPIAWTTTLILSYMLKTTALFGDLSFSTIHVTIGAFLLVLSYAAIVFGLIRFWKKRLQSSSLPSAS